MSKRKMTAEYLKEMVKKSFANVDIGYGGKMCVLPFQSLVDTTELYEDKIAWQEVEFQQLKEDYESIVEENSLLKADHKLMSDKLIALEVETNNQKAEIERLKDEFKTDYRNSWKNKFFSALEENRERQKQVDELKGKICELVANKCNLVVKEQQSVKDTAKEIFEKIFEVLCCFTTQGKSEDYNEGYIDCLAEVDKRLQNLAKEKYGVEV
jgi:hypothetical protein